MSEETPRELIRQEHQSEELFQRTKDQNNRQNNIDDKQNQYRTERKTRFPRACTARSSLRYGYVEDEPSIGKKRRRGVTSARRDKLVKEKQCDVDEEVDEAEAVASGGSSTRVITTLVQKPDSPEQLPRWSIRSMWEFASLLDFLHVFRPLLNITAEFSAEELETAFITPNGTLDDIHIPMLKSIPPVTRMALGRATWVTVLCRKLRDWWHWVADGELPIVASHGTEIETYKELEPATRVLIMKALCDIRVEQEDIRSYIDNSVKHGMKLSAFRRERIGGDSHGVSYWYEDDPIIGHRLYRETRKIQTKKLKGKGLPTIPLISCQWETVATNLDEFEEVSDKLLSSTNRTEVSLGKKLKIDILPEVEEIHKKKEKSLKKQHRQALLLDSFLTADGLTSGRSLRDRKPVTYTFDDFDRSINEAIKITKRRPTSPEQHVGRKDVSKPETSSNGNKSNGPSHIPQHLFYDNQSPKFSEYEESDGEDKNGVLDRSDRRRKRSQRYSEKDYVEAISENDADFDSDDEIVGEVVYDEEYLRQRKQKKISSSSEGDEEYSWEGENAEEEEEEAEDSLSISEDSDDSSHLRKFSARSMHGTKKLRSVDDHQASPRRSRRSTRPRINYRQYEISESEADSTKLEKSNASDMRSDPNSDPELSIPSRDSRDEDGIEMKDFNPNHNPNPNSNPNPPKNPDIVTAVEEAPKKQLMEQNNSNPIQEGSQQRRFLDLNELAGFDDGSSPPSIQGDGGNNF